MGTSKLQSIHIFVALAAVVSLFMNTVETATGYFEEVSKSRQIGYLEGLNSFAPKLEPAEVDQNLSIQKTHTGDFNIGVTGTYTIEVTNQGPEASTGPITITDTLPTGLSYSTASGVGWDSCGAAGQEVTCVYSSTTALPPQASLTPLILEVNVAQEAAPVVTNTVTLSNANDPDDTNNSANDVTTIVSADLAVSKTVAPLLPAEGDQVAYTVIVTNNGPSPTSGVVLTDTLPSGLVFISAVPSTGNYEPVSGRWNIGNLLIDGAATLVINAQVELNTRGQTIVNTVEALSSQLYDYEPSNNSDSATIRVQSTSLLGQVTDAATTLPVAEAIVVLTDSQNHVYSTSTTPSGYYTFTETITDPIAPGIAQVSASKEGYVTESTTKELQNSFDNIQNFELDTVDLVVAKEDGQTTVTPGEEIIYTLTITNTGTITATNVIITDVLSSELEYIDDSSDITPDEPTDGTFVWELDDPLGIGETIEFDLEAQVAWALPEPDASVVNTVSASTSSPEANLANNTAQDVNTATGTPDIEFKKSVDPTQVRRGQSLIYTIVVSNDGTAAVTDVEVTDTFSSYLNLTSATTTKGSATRNTTTRTVTAKIDVLDADEKVTIRVFATVNSLATFNLTATNRSDLTYTFGGDETDMESNQVSLRILGTSTLPGTGGIEPKDAQQSTSPWAFILALVSSLLLAAFALMALAGGFVAKIRGSDWASWLFKMGMILTAATILFGLAGWALWPESTVAEHPVPLVTPADRWVQEDGIQADIPDEPEFSVDIDDYYVSEPETLPDYPIPTPTVEVMEEGEPPADISPVERIVLPSIGVDTVVKFVPYDGFTWLIGGLKQEVAWMGDTSWPGLGGNTALAGHVTLSEGGDGPFRNLVNLTAGDQVYLYTEENMYTYQVKDQQTVGETDVSVLVRGEEAQITLITCTNWNEDAGFYKDRLIVWADLVDVQPLAGENQTTLTGSAQFTD